MVIYISVVFLFLLPKTVKKGVSASLVSDCGHTSAYVIPNFNQVKFLRRPQGPHQENVPFSIIDPLCEDFWWQEIDVFHSVQVSGWLHVSITV